jgi:nitroreductase
MRALGRDLRCKFRCTVMMDIGTIDHLLTTTRSVRKRLDLTRLVEPEVLERCIEIAMQAPTALYGQTWHFVVVTDPVRKAGI